MGRPWISVVMPTYNGAAYLSAALESLVLQRATDLELIVVDDGSTDETCRILRSYHDRLPIRLIDEGRRGNWVAATNRGLVEARGEFIGFLHQDDLWEPDRLVALRRLTRELPGAALYVHPAYFRDREGLRVGCWRCPLPGHGCGYLDSRTVLPRLLVQNFIPIPSAVFRREAMRDIGGMDDRLWYTADWDFWLKLVASGLTVYLPRPLASFRIHAGSQTATRCKEVDDFGTQMGQVFETHWAIARQTFQVGEIYRKVGRFSIDVNMRLAARYHGGPVPWTLARDFLGLGPQGWRIYLRDSRLLERVASRLRASLNQPVRQSKPERPGLGLDHSVVDSPP